MLILFASIKIPTKKRNTIPISVSSTFKRLILNSRYREGVIAQMFYVGAQIMCWTFIIQYADNLGIPKSEAQNFNIIAMILFLISRFICTYLMKIFESRKLLTFFSIGGIFSILGVIFFHNIMGLYLLIATSVFMSLMFPTIYAIALSGLGDDTALGSSGLVMAIVGGALMPPIQGWIIDRGPLGGLDAVNVSFVLPLICFCVIAIYGYRTLNIHNSLSDI